LARELLIRVAGPTQKNFVGLRERAVAVVRVSQLPPVWEPQILALEVLVVAEHLRIRLTIGYPSIPVKRG